jgi:predicted RNA binding protein YcfA (HicA-like mRNA interferase family)
MRLRSPGLKQSGTYEGRELGKLSNISGKEAVKAFANADWRTQGQVGSHLVMTRAGKRANLSIPQHKELSVGTLRSLIRSAEVSVDEFLALL